MLREQRWRSRFGSPSRRAAIATVAVAATAASLYGLSVLVTAFLPG
jgi:hypothetical protein